MINPEKRTNAEPFREVLVRSSFDKDLKIKSIMTLASDPNMIIRVDKNYADFFMGYQMPDFTAEEKHKQYLGAKLAFDDLSTRYGISIVRHDFVIGPNPDNPNQPIYYTVSERIDGPNLHEKQYNEKEKPVVWKKLDSFYSSLADYIWNIYQKGGWIIDIFDSVARNKQFVYGKRQGETEDKVWFVDVDGKAWFRQPHDHDIFPRLECLIQMIQETESKLGTKFTRSRQTMIKHLKSLSEKNPDYRSALLVRRDLQDSTAGSDHEDQLALARALDEFFQIQPDIKFDKADYKQTLIKFFSRKPLMEEYNRQRESIVEMGTSFDSRWYNPYARIQFENQAIYLVRDRLYEKGQAIFESVEQHHGSILPLMIVRIKPEVLKKLKTMPYDFYLRAKAENDREAISEIGWESDVLAHLDAISEIFRFHYREKCLDSYRNYYLELACKQHNLPSSLPIKTNEVIKMFRQYQISRKRSPKFTPANFGRFASNIVRNCLNHKFSQKLENLNGKYGSTNVGLLDFLFESIETERLTREAFQSPADAESE